jgi:hypothetical protein
VKRDVLQKQYSIGRNHYLVMARPSAGHTGDESLIGGVDTPPLDGRIKPGHDE